MSVRTPVIGAGCMDCTLVTNHPTTTKATTALTAHISEQPDHRPLISDNNGWHRVWLNTEGAS